MCPVKNLGATTITEFQMKCKKCNKLLFESDTNCPDCGRAVQGESYSVRWGWLFIIAAVVILFLLTRRNF